MVSTEGVPQTLDPSKLGSKSYWNECYERELVNHAANPDDEGTIWFAETGAEEKMALMLEDMAESGLLRKEAHGDLNPTSFIDLGTGNGHLLFSLRDDGWTGRMVGLDYSSSSIALARQIDQARQIAQTDDNASTSVEFQEHDILSGDLHLAPVNILLDKGTFDAISLSGIANSTRLYRERVKFILHTNGYLIITSCNWTEAELRTWLESDDDVAEFIFDFVDRIKYPSFRFGGSDGQTVVTLCFQLRKRQEAL